ncbi:selenocysteine synthase [[Clostridium] sordellii]|uniref:L-seryl-tRNA(Sec) selenium transferase n=1 Tax=Paraclostridium sordellii TaxID=1505 RepID=UPI0005E3E9ED|nr:L-seryl-tRNA(Sec) selenium transferase [Paeniclostridium sordellii]MCQ4697696.1 L-seryl-tRNA(Sec) selenium transferase [Paeniclostridium sordellii]MDU2147138.1 L-seryl-tRNA(Sec) selenium transferase [Paeniclostridium sordellii]MDU4412214.1 L-seryl-tRNA(Sec) selenium transferase [Paeniclostridium sordellii]MDU6480866.1 L-seryl-tRNA(Sec) selenium transferase [Paeniclostridium sordellii]MRZ27637.1 L-seryl-tRNA(Sec) selenium transferase [Paeniclostridium sordellii]
MNKRELFAQLPSVDEVLNQEKIIDALNEYPRNILLEAIREAIEEKRREIVDLNQCDFDKFEISIEKIVLNVINKCNIKYSLSLKKVINGTGTVLHTNLGRSLLSESIKEELWEAASRYSNLEYDIDKGQRGSRYTHLTETIKRLTGAEDVLVVNNNAAAVLLVLSTMAKGGEAIVSRGELVEVGGSFRIPSIMSLSGADLVEVGSTNKTHLKDYEEAINEETKVLMKVHTSNYRILGFTQSVEVDELCELGKKYDLPVIEDLGSGVFLDVSKYGLSYEPTVLDSINKGADIVTFSGDKMLGGPQAGIIVGKKEYIEKMKKNQLTRALRVDKLTICALEATLRMYLDEEKARKEIPTLKMLTYSMEELEEKANKLYSKIEYLNKYADIKIENGSSQVGGGSMPLELIDSKVITIIPNEINVAMLEKKLRLGDAHIIARVYDDKYVLDARTIFEDEFEIVKEELEKALIGG